MKTYKLSLCSGAALFFAVLAASHGGTLIEEHVDVRFHYDTASSAWVGGIRYGPHSNPTNLLSGDEAVLPARDLAATAGDRFVQPSSSAFTFTGAQAGAPLWILSQADNSYTWPGFANTNAPGTFAAYSESDPRAGTSSPQRWIKIALQSLEYSGAAAAPHFSLWQTSGGPPVVYMSTADGIGTDDVFFLLEAGHSHMNWGFTALGVYRIGFRAAARLAGGAPIESSTYSFTFTIGTFATWRGRYFAGADLVNDAISGPDSDRDGDGLKLLTEYAFDLSPTLPDRAVVMTPTTGTRGLPVIRVETISGTRRLTIEFVRRKAATNPQISYAAEFSNSVAAGWASTGTTVVTSIDPTWERVKVTDSVVVTSTTARFARVKVTLLPAINY